MDVNEPEFWSDAYAEGRAGWDLKTPTPVFAHLLEHPPAGFADRFAHGNACVPCCGLGHDAILFARHGFAVTAIDFAPEPLQSLARNAADLGVDVATLQADLFDLPAELDGRFDIVLEYTCICAIDPRRRAEFLRVMHRILVPGGLFISLLFPLDGRPGGPPFTIDEAEFLALMEKDFDLALCEYPEFSVRPRLGREKLLICVKKIHTPLCINR